MFSFLALAFKIRLNRKRSIRLRVNHLGDANLPPLTMPHPVSRRQALGTLAAGGALAAASLLANPAPPVAPVPPVDLPLKGNIRHSVSRWCFGKIPLETFCVALKSMGVPALDLVEPADFPTLRRQDIACSLVSAPNVKGIGGIARAWNRLEHHDTLVEAYTQRLAATAEADHRLLICFSGNRAGLDDEQGLENCAAGLRRILPTAERLKVNLCMELLNSKVNHKDYQCDRTAWGVELVKRVGSERFKLLYDIYHMQIMEGDVCATIQAYHPYFAHYHTAGVPGRHEIDETQELYYPRIMRAILDTGYKGYVAQEFTPSRPDALASLRQAFQICDV
jgi:hydroxypyruvate isomerase